MSRPKAVNPAVSALAFEIAKQERIRDDAHALAEKLRLIKLNIEHDEYKAEKAPRKHRKKPAMVELPAKVEEAAQ